MRENLAVKSQAAVPVRSAAPIQAIQDWRPQWRALTIMLVLYMLSAALYMIVPGGSLDPRSAEAVGMAPQVTTLPVWQLVLANAGIVLVVYGLIGSAGLWLSRRAGLPGIFRPGAGWANWFVRPLGLGVIAGLILVGTDLAVKTLTGTSGFPHPLFPASILASFSAGIGEEILTRLFVLSLWALALTWLLRHLAPHSPTRRTALWIANVIGALAFAATHLPTAMILAGVASPAALPPVMLAEIMILNGLIGLIAGEAYIRDGLVAASGVHFWCDMVWHVLYVVVR